MHNLPVMMPSCFMLVHSMTIMFAYWYTILVFCRILYRIIWYCSGEMTKRYTRNTMYCEYYTYSEYSGDAQKI